MMDKEGTKAPSWQITFAVPQTWQLKSLRQNCQIKYPDLHTLNRGIVDFGEFNVRAWPHAGTYVKYKYS